MKELQNRLTWTTIGDKNEQKDSSRVPNMQNEPQGITSFQPPQNELYPRTKNYSKQLIPEMISLKIINTLIICISMIHELKHEIKYVYSG